MPDLLPKLKRISVDTGALYPDPNNPRFITKEGDRVKEDQFLDATVILKTASKMYDKDNDVHNIKQLVDSIKANGWQDVDCIFVRSFEEGRYVVLEGNRRLTAIRAILDDPESPEEIKVQLKEIEVMEIVDKIDGRRTQKSEQELRQKISYLLGVRHHGSLKQWSPFAQAANIYERYLSTSGQSDSSFEWNKLIAERIAEKLSMKVRDVEERIRVFRAMKQIGDSSVVKASEARDGDEKGGMQGRYYSVCKEVLTTKSDKLSDFVRVNDDFTLDDESLQRMVALCHFDKKGRKGSPINNPQQWRFFTKILGDDNEVKREANVKRVVENKEKPETVWAEREAELLQPEWGKWLSEVARLFDKLQFKDVDVDSEKAAEVMKKLTGILDNLECSNG